MGEPVNSITTTTSDVLRHYGSIDLQYNQDINENKVDTDNEAMENFFSNERRNIQTK
jgi:hypothetical protein